MKNQQWKKQKFSKIVSLVSEKFYPQNEAIKSICIELEDINQGTGTLSREISTKQVLSAKNKFQADDVLFGKLRPYLRKYYLASFHGICSTEIWVLRNNPNFCVAKYLFYLVQGSKFNKYANIVSGTKMPRSDWNVVSDLILNIPPIAEQKKIAEILGTCDRQIELTENLINAKRKLKQGLMQKLLTGKLRFPEFIKSHSFKKHHFLRFPNDWELYSIGDICKECNEKNAEPETTVLSCTKYDGLVPSLEYFGRQVYGNNLDKYKIVRKNQFAYATNHIEEGSIGLLKNLDIGLVSPIYTVFETSVNFVLPDFLILILKTELYRQVFESLTHASVDRRGSLRWAEFKKIKLAIPSLDEQKAITRTFHALNSEILQLENKSLHLKQQKKALMQQLLTGKTRVKVD